MRVLSIVEDSIVDGPGLRTTIFLQGVRIIVEDAIIQKVGK